jgi:hypothetical protein
MHVDVLGVILESSSTRGGIKRTDPATMADRFFVDDLIAVRNAHHVGATFRSST